MKAEKEALSFSEYEGLKTLVLESAQDFHTLYEAIPDKNRSCLPARKTFYGQIPRTANEIYYSEVTSLEEIAKSALMPNPQKEDNISEDKIREVVIFYPESAGLPRDASMEQIAEKLIETWKESYW